MKSSLTRPDLGAILTGQNVDRLLNFYGVIKDNENLPVEDAVVMAFACYAGGIERSLGSAFTDSQGRYLISIPKLADQNGLLGFKVRAGKEATILSEGVESQDKATEHPGEELTLVEEKIFENKIAGTLTEHCSDDVIPKGKADEGGKIRLPDMKKAGWIEKFLFVCVLGIFLLVLTLKRR